VQQEPVPETPTAAASSLGDSELHQLIEEIGTKIETQPAVPSNGNGFKPATVVMAHSAPASPEVKPLFTSPPTRPRTATPPTQPGKAAYVLTPSARGPYVVKKAVPKDSGSKMRRIAKPIIFGVLAVDIALGAIFVIHQHSGASSDGKPAAASVMSIPESSAEDGTLVTDDAERAQGGVPMRVSVPASTMQENIVRMVPATRPAGTGMIENDKVLLNATINRDGSVRSVRVIDGDRKLAKAATDAVMQWRYKPYLVNGQPADVETQITVNFNSAANRPAR
jgi:TonB family protein